MQFSILILYLLSLFFLGFVTIKLFRLRFPILLELISAWLLGTFIGVPITYLLSCLFMSTGDPMVWGVAGTIVTIAITYSALWITNKKFIIRAMRIKTGGNWKFWNMQISDIFLVIFALIFSTWMMMKTFHGGGAGELFVGSNTVFDFGHALGIIRSFSWGNNIPFTSPFESGLPFFYHFFFYFYIAIWEYFGVPLVWAMNILSILSFTALLIVSYFLPQQLFKSGKLGGWGTVILTITHPTLAFWEYLQIHGWSVHTVQQIWRLPTYPFAGPFDGSIISLFMTLNNYVNQRHLAFAVAFAWLLFIGVSKMFDEKRMEWLKSVVLGILVGCMVYWNMFVMIIIGCIIAIFYVQQKNLKQLCYFFSAALVISGLSLFSYISVFGHILQETKYYIGGNPAGIHAQWNIFNYLWMNLSILPGIGILGIITMKSDRRKYAWSIVVLFISVCLYAGVGMHGFDQKFFSFLIVGINAITVVGIVWIWEHKQVVWKCGALIILFILTISGVLDLMAIKNEFAYPFINQETAQEIQWIHEHTSKNAVFVSYKDMIDPIVLAGRKNFSGFYGNIGSSDRTNVIRQFYAGNMTGKNMYGITYIVLPKDKKNDFSYFINWEYFQTTYPSVFTDTSIMIIKL